jgi:hypothetical protein
MAQLSRALRSLEGGGLAFWCPGCEEGHAVWIGEGPGPRWGYNGNPDKPTFTPSILVKYWRATPEGRAMMDRGEKLPPGVDRYPGTQEICHSFVTDGRIQFLGDCTSGRPARRSTCRTCRSGRQQLDSHYQQKVELSLRAEEQFQ